jgi:uncharacterized protein (TIGR03086 family)
MTHPDLKPAAQRMATLIDGISDAQLSAPCPCSEITLGDLVHHISELTIVFTGAAKKDPEAPSRGAPPDGSQLGDDWRTRMPHDLSLLAEAWRDSDAWSGMTKAGGGDMPAEIAGIVALDELVLHGWDVARASGQDYECDQASLEAAYEFVAPFSEPGMEAQRGGLFGPVVAVPDGAPPLDRLLALSGRDPAWTPGERDRRRTSE